jgi:hypothetical protein
VKIVPAAVRASFLDALRRVSRHAGGLPDPLPMGRVLRVVDRQSASADHLRVLAGNDGSYYLDYFRVNGDASSHCRLRAGGAVETLENYEGQFGMPVQDDEDATRREHARIAAHNVRVSEVLRRKGFED